uniref:F-box domain-containing protein n=1 Tax=Bionectria ochroleuca TaxID=29856 RepID=A0A8H7K4W0_BIOOC
MPFPFLPNEILHRIVADLDSISLISLSQTSIRFRQVIKPAKREFVERLLALECTEPFDAGFAQRSGWWTYEAWKSTRWACSGCLKLLSHSHFDNRSLLRRGYRKPPPEAPAANTLTTWKPSLYGKKWGGRVGPYVSQDARRRRYHYYLLHIYEHQDPITAEAILQMRDAGIEALEELTEEQIRLCPDEARSAVFDKVMEDLELEDMGTKRHFRRCNECRYLKNPVGRRGTLVFPIQISLNLYFATPLDRYFPTYWEFFANKRPVFQKIVEEHYLGRLIGQHWQMYMARCPGCQKWQEIRAFRLGGKLTSWKPVLGHTTWEDETISTSLLDEARCNTCFEKEHGREELGNRLLLWIHFLQEEHLRELASYYDRNWASIQLRLEFVDPCADHDEVVKQQIDDLVSPMRESHILDNAETDHLTPLAEEVGRLVKEFQEENGINLNLKNLMDQQINIERQWIWLRASMAEVQRNPDALVCWALSRDGSIQK